MERLIRLPQFYTRRTATTVWQEGPAQRDEALLEVSPEGFVQSYPGLWEHIEAQPRGLASVFTPGVNEGRLWTVQLSTRGLKPTLWSLLD